MLSDRHWGNILLVWIQRRGPKYGCGGKKGVSGRKTTTNPYSSSGKFGNQSGNTVSLIHTFWRGKGKDRMLQRGGSVAEGPTYNWKRLDGNIYLGKRTTWRKENAVGIAKDSGKQELELIAT